MKKFFVFAIVTLLFVSVSSRAQLGGDPPPPPPELELGSVPNPDDPKVQELVNAIDGLLDQVNDLNNQLNSTSLLYVRGDVADLYQRYGELAVIIQVWRISKADESLIAQDVVSLKGNPRFQTTLFKEDGFRTEGNDEIRIFPMYIGGNPYLSIESDGVSGRISGSAMEVGPVVVKRWLDTSIPMNLKTGLNLISLPAEVVAGGLRSFVDLGATTIVTQDGGWIHSIFPQSYEDSANVVPPGRGFFVNMARDNGIGFTFTEWTKEVALDLYPGVNLLGIPFRGACTDLPTLWGMLAKAGFSPVAVGRYDHDFGFLFWSDTLQTEKDPGFLRSGDGWIAVVRNGGRLDFYDQAPRFTIKGAPSLQTKNPETVSLQNFLERADLTSADREKLEEITSLDKDAVSPKGKASTTWAEMKRK